MPSSQDPFAAARDQSGTLDGVVVDDEFVMVLRYDELKRIGRDWQTFTSNTPFRVPIPREDDVRAVRQLPIETDPPEHGRYRAVVRSPFSREHSSKIRPVVLECVDELLDGLTGDGSAVEIVHDLAVPLQCRALALMLGRPRADATIWESWGTHVFRDAAAGPHGEQLDEYLERVVDESMETPGDDFFGLLAASDVDGRPLEREEILGFANLTFAGGRDTVIHLMTNAIHHLATEPGALELLRSDPAAIPTAIEEFLRHSSPISHIGRTATAQTSVCGRLVERGQLVSLGFAAANRDPSAFECPNDIVLDRTPNRHMAFGHGPHTCLGAPHTRMLLDVLLTRLVQRVADVELIEATDKIESFGTVSRRASFDRLVVRFTSN